MFIAKDLNQFKTLFVNQLKNMLSDDELGAFILVLANSRQDIFLKSALQADLESNFFVLKNKFSTGKLKATQDDIDVFKKLLDSQLENIPIWKNKTIGDWEVVCNEIRKLRPARASSQRLNSIKQPYDETMFHFNKPFLKPEILWEGEFNGMNSRVLFNKFPFADYHLLIVVSPEKNTPQVLSKHRHEYAFSLVTKMGKVLPGFGIGYNSLAAGASVNHLHFQEFVRQQDFSIEKNNWLHNAGSEKYPLHVKRFSDFEESWLYINKLTDNDEAFNCLYRNNCCYVVPRKYQNQVDLPEWLTGAGWLDVAGVMTVSDEDAFDLISQPSVTQALGLLLS